MHDAHELPPDAIEELLREETVARVAYVDRRGLPCIVPINFAYDGRALYGYSLSGSKIEHMSASPQVCVEIERVRDAAHWTSVILRGTFQQLEGADARDAVARISERLNTVARADGTPADAARTYVARFGGPGIAYRIAIAEKRGRSSAAVLGR